MRAVIEKHDGGNQEPVNRKICVEMVKTASQLKHGFHVQALDEMIVTEG